ncbi:hypothetical protein TNCV_2037431 [Trichonephila clavipes]|nr:hypothetical protein TNCV_2037431 [Trichonephila clavipes]
MEQEKFFSTPERRRKKILFSFALLGKPPSGEECDVNIQSINQSTERRKKKIFSASPFCLYKGAPERHSTSFHRMELLLPWIPSGVNERVIEYHLKLLFYPGYLAVLTKGSA